MKVSVKLIEILSLISYILSQELNCEINSHIVAVDNLKKSNYNLLISLSTNDNCPINCEFTNSSILIEMTESYNFYGRNYYFYKAQNLQNLEIYPYQCGVQNSMNNYSIQFPKNEKTTNILTFGDWSKHNNGLLTFDRLNKIMPNNKYDAFVTLGDYSYDLGSNTDYKWDNGNTFFEWIKNITSALPFMMNAGNHEYRDKDFTQYIKRFLMPNKKMTDNLYYSFDINDVHFVSVTSEFGLIEYRGGKDYYTTFKNWFREDLKSSKKKWKVVYLHRPLYCSLFDLPRCTTEAEKLRNFFEDLFYESKIDIVLAGHLHNYERMYPIYKGEVDIKSLSADQNVYTNPKYPTHIICGTAGNQEGTNKPYNYSKYVSNQGGVCQLNFTNNNLTVNFINNDGETLDSFQIVKKNSFLKPRN